MDPWVQPRSIYIFITKTYVHNVCTHVRMPPSIPDSYVCVYFILKSFTYPTPPLTPTASPRPLCSGNAYHLQNKCHIHVLNIGYVSNETNTYGCMYIEEFILVEIWIHCCTKLNLKLDKHWKNARLYTLATKD